jgi:hypothetical protein
VNSKLLGGVCFKFRNNIAGNIWATIDSYKVDITLFLGMEVPWNKITFNNFSYFHDYIPKEMRGKEKFL